MAAARHLRKRSFQLAGHRTSVALEAEFWSVSTRPRANVRSAWRHW